MSSDPKNESSKSAEADGDDAKKSAKAIKELEAKLKAAEQAREAEVARAADTEKQALEMVAKAEAHAAELEAKLAAATKDLEDATAELAHTRIELKHASQTIDTMRSLIKDIGGDASKTVALSTTQVREILATDHQAEFEVIDEWKNGSNKFGKARRLRAHHYPHFVDFVLAGLKVRHIEREKPVATVPTTVAKTS